LKMLIFHIGITGALVIGGFYLDLFPEGSTAGFLSIFFIAAIFGYLSTYFFQKIKPKKYLDKERHSLKDFFTFKGMFGKFILFIFIFSFAHMLVNPFFKVYVLENLSMSYSFYVMVIATSTIGRLISIVHIGKLTDLVGDKKVAVISTAATAFSPFAYLFINDATVWLLFPVHLIIGIAWAGIEVSTLNLLMNYSTKKQRGIRAAQFYMMSAIPMVVAPIAGGLIADNVTLMAFSGIPLVFLIATVLRSVPAFLLLRLKEVRVKKKYSYLDVLKRYAQIDPAKEAKNSMQEIEHLLWHKHHWHKQRR